MSLLAMCLQGSAMVLVVLIMRATVGRHLSRMTFYILWLLVIARFLVSFALPVWAGGSQVMPQTTEIQETDATSSTSSEPIPTPAPTGETPSALAAPGDIFDATRTDVTTVARTVWAAGSTVLASTWIALYAWSLARVRRGSCVVKSATAMRWLEANRGVRHLCLRESDKTKTPFTYGIIRPIIVVPAGFGWQDESSDLVLAHELMHARRFDPLLKITLNAIACLYWFDPVAWLLRTFCSRDIELSCDELVTRRMNMATRRTYALALLDAASHSHAGAGFVTSFTSDSLTERVHAIMKGGTRAVWAPAVSAVLILCLTVWGATTTRAAEPEGSGGGASAEQEAIPAVSESDDRALSSDSDTGDGWVGSTTVRPADTMRGSSELVSELVGEGTTHLVTPHYTLALPDAFTARGITWEYLEDGGSVSPDGAVGTLAIREQASGSVIAMAFCMADEALPRMPMEDFVPDYDIMASTREDDPLTDGPSRVIVAVAQDAADAPATELPYLTSTGSLSQVYGIAPGQASRDAYIAWAESDQGGVRIHAQGYSVLVPSDVVEKGMASFYLGSAEAPGHVDELLVQFEDTELALFQVSADQVDSAREKGAAPVGTTPSGTTVMMAVSHTPSSDGAGPEQFASWASAEG